MTKTKIVQVIIDNAKVFGKLAGGYIIDETTRLEEDLGMFPLDVVQYLMALEEVLALRYTPTEVSRHFTTIGKIIQLSVKKINV